MTRARAAARPRLSTTGRTLINLYDALLEPFGPQHWWPARSRFEVIVGAILTQNTSWTNVERAIANLRRAKLLSRCVRGECSCQHDTRWIHNHCRQL